MSRGHLIVWDSDTRKWSYEDGEPYDDSRNCVECLLVHEPWGPDVCIGWLTGMKSVCCGHGGRSKAICMIVPRLTDGCK